MKKLKDIFNHPYAAPIATPLKWGGEALSEPTLSLHKKLISPIWKSLKAGKGFSDALDDAANAYPDNGTNWLAGAALGGFAGVCGGGVLIFSGPNIFGITSLVAKIAIGVCLPFAGALAAPLVIAGAWTAGAAAMACVAVPFGVASGCLDAVKHFKGAAPATPIPAATSVPTTPPQMQQKSIDKILDDMDPKKRREKLKKLEEKFADDFAAIRGEKFQGDAVLKQDLSIDPPFKLKQPK